MNPSLPYVDYVNALRGLENEPASFKRLLGPFGIAGLPSHEDEFLLVGHLLEALDDAELRGQPIDATAIVELALDLGMSTAA